MKWKNNCGKNLIEYVKKKKNKFMKDTAGNINKMLSSLEGLWVGDCIGNIGQLYSTGNVIIISHGGKYEIKNTPCYFIRFLWSAQYIESSTLCGAHRRCKYVRHKDR